MSIPATDNFNTGTSAVSANWQMGFGSFTVITNELASNSGGDNLMFWGADVFTRDQSSQITVTTIGSFCGLAVRCIGDTGYVLICDGTSIADLYKVVEEDFEFLHSFGGGIAANDVLKLSVIGSMLRFYRNGVEVGSGFSDSALLSGAPGVYGSGAANRYDNFIGDNIFPPFIPSIGAVKFGY